MNKQTEAQRIASELTIFAVWPDDYTGTLEKATAELRRIEAEHEFLTADRDRMERYWNEAMATHKNQAAIEVENKRVRDANKKLADELRKVVKWAQIEKAPLRQQEISSILKVLADHAV